MTKKLKTALADWPVRLDAALAARFSFEYETRFSLFTGDGRYVTFRKDRTPINKQEAAFIDGFMACEEGRI